MFILQYLSYINLYGYFLRLLFQLFCPLPTILSAEKSLILLSDYITCTCVIYLHNCFHLEISPLTKSGMCYCSFITERDQQYKVYLET